MNRARDEFFAGAGLSRDKNGSVGRRDTCNFLPKLANCNARPRNFQRTLKAGHRVTKPVVLPQELGVFYSPVRTGEQHLGHERFGDEIKRAAPHRMLSTASSMVAKAVRKTTDKAGSVSRAAARTSNPSPSLIF